MITAVIERCVGIDVGKKALSVCVMTGPAEGGSAAPSAHIWDDDGGTAEAA